MVKILHLAGADPGFQVRGGALKKIAPIGGRRENILGISCEKSRFYAKKSNFFQLPREARKFLGYFVWKITILRQKIIFFPIAEGGAKGISCEKSRFYAKKSYFFPIPPPPRPESAPALYFIEPSAILNDTKNLKTAMVTIYDFGWWLLLNVQILS